MFFFLVNVGILRVLGFGGLALMRLGGKVHVCGRGDDADL